LFVDKIEFSTNSKYFGRKNLTEKADATKLFFFVIYKVTSKKIQTIMGMFHPENSLVGTRNL
jgi:hypothetical protein